MRRTPNFQSPIAFRSPWAAAIAAAALLILPAGAPIEAAEGGPCELVETYLDIWRSGDLSGLEGLLTPDFKHHAGPAESTETLDQLRQLIEALHDFYDDPRIEVEGTIDAAEGCAYRGTFRGLHRETGKSISFAVMGMTRVAGDRIVEEWVIGANLKVLLAFGYKLAPPGFGARATSDEALAPGSDGGTGEGAGR